MALITLFLAALLALPASAQDAGQFNSTCFLGLNDADTPSTLADCEAQAALNTESNLAGSAIIKRKGYAKSADLTVATGPVTGSHSFIDSFGNKKDIVCQDLNCSASTNGNEFATFLTTAASGITRWSWVDVGGIAYGANNKFDKIVKYDGTTRSSPAGMPLGSILELSQDRLIIGDISGSPNRVHKSSAGAYEQFTVGINPEDSYFDEIGAPGYKIRGIKCHGGVCDYFKTASITRCEEADQYNTQCSVLSPNIGTTDPGSIVTAGSSVFFRAQDKNYWEISPRGFRQISQKIPNLVKSQSGGLGGGEQSNTQTTQSDWQNGVQSPTGTWNTASLPGSIFPSTPTLADISTTTFSLGTTSGTGNQFSVNSIGFGAVTSTYSVRYEADALPEDAAQPWTKVFDTGSASVSAGTLTITGAKSYSIAFATSTPSNILIVARAMNAIGSDLSIQFKNGTSLMTTLQLYTAQEANYYYDNSRTKSDAGVGASFSTYTILVSTAGDMQYWRNGIFRASSTITMNPGPVSAVYFGTSIGTAYIKALYISKSVGSLNGENIVSISTFTSRIFDTSFTTPTAGPFTSTATIPANTAITYAVRTSTSPNNDFWGAYELVVPPARPVAYTNRYWQYKLTMKQSNLTESPGISAVTLQIAATGFYTTQCIQPNSSISAWGTLSCAETLAGNGSIVYYATSAATCATLPSADPGSWQTSVTNNATLPIALNTAVKIGWRSLLTSATDQAQIDACTLAWNEGTSAQPSWAVFDSVKQAIYWTATINGASSTNRLLKYDLNNGYWYPFDIPAQAPKMINNSLYFGGASSGTWNKYGGVDADAGGAINAYWQSHDIGAANPFQEKEFQSASILSRNNQAGSMTATYTFSNAESGAYTISLSTGAGITYARSNFNLPKTSPQNFISLRIGNNSTTPFEVLGLGITWATWPWRVTTE